jgi:hypothetical protein
MQQVKLRSPGVRVSYVVVAGGQRTGLVMQHAGQEARPRECVLVRAREDRLRELRGRCVTAGYKAEM